jgi:hypothetical protein
LCLADGYLSADEQIHGQEASKGEPDDDDDQKGPVVDFALLKASNQHCQLDEVTTGYFNALLAAKNQAQPVIICRIAGVQSATGVFTTLRRLLAQKQKCLRRCSRAFVE